MTAAARIDRSARPSAHPGAHPAASEPREGMRRLKALLAEVAAPAGHELHRPVGLPRDLHQAIERWSSRRCVG